jgi:tetratricopeptide (TPR) repeat protein
MMGVCEMLVDICICDFQTGESFEELVSELFRYLGYSVHLTAITGDQGVDIIMENPSVGTIAVQCKKYSGKVSNSAIQEVFAGKHFYSCNKAIVVTNSYYTASAKKLAKSLDVELFDRDRLQKIFIDLENVLKETFFQNKKLVEILVNTGASLYQAGRYETGISLLREIVCRKNDISPEFAFLAYNNLGLCYKGIRDYEKSVVTYIEATGLSALDTHDKNILLNNLFVTYRDVGNLEKAKETLDKIDLSNESEMFVRHTEHAYTQLIRQI